MSLSIGGLSLQLLQRGSISAAGGARVASGPAATVIGIASGGPRVDPTMASADADSTEDLFTADTSTVTQLKIALFDKVGEAFGIKREEYRSEAEFYRAVKSMYSALERQENSHLFIAQIEAKVGLHELGISLRAVVNAMVEPNGKDAEKLDALLDESARASEEQAKANAMQVKAMEAERAKTETAPLKPVKDDLGIYDHKL